jgi:hypothetical protein
MSFFDRYPQKTVKFFQSTVTNESHNKKSIIFTVFELISKADRIPHPFKVIFLYGTSESGSRCKKIEERLDRVVNSFRS